ncbi:MAG: alpha/beta fold hydrolase, partial [Bryobacteraceae bacterium]
MALTHIVRLTSALWLLGPGSLPAQQVPASGQRIAAGARFLWLVCQGAGQPGVLLEAGHGEASDTWVAVQSRVASFTRVCRYDRAGRGQSYPAAPGRGRHGRDVIADLHALLTGAGEPGPLVLVGHSLGGAFVRLYAASHPDATAGLVLVDAVHEREFEAIDQLLTPEQRTGGAGTHPMSPEGIDIEGVFAELREVNSQVAVPVVVVARGRPLQHDEMPPNWSSEQRRRREELRKSLQADLATRFPRGELIVAAGSGHFVHHDRPDVVVIAIRKIVEA